MSANDMRFARQEGPVDYIILTNRDHTREAGELKNEFHCTVMAPELDAKEMSITIDKTFKDGELLPGGIWVVQLAHQKSPGESALFLETGKGILIVGDAVIGYPAGSLRLLPPEKYADIVQAREGLRRLLKYNFDSLIVGDGASIVTAAKPILERTLAEA
jgi:glyoxylase-like metal-dependent hydrolase (beta-lactamase superfamily II)